MQPSLEAPYAPTRPEGVDTSTAWSTLVEHLTPILLAPTEVVGLEVVITNAATDLVSLVQHDPDVAIFRLVNPNQEAMRNYGVEHSVHTGVLMAMIARHKEWSDERTLHAVCAALTMNIAITQLQSDLASQIEPPSAAQRLAIKEHPTRSRDLLVAAGIMHLDWLRAVLEHHEQHNGSGYPQGLRTVSPLSDALRTCDMFCAKLSERTSRNQLLSTRAAQEIFRQSSYGYFGATIVRLLGMYPPGCLIKLLSGATAVVVQRTTDPMRPRVALVTHDNGELRDAPLYSATGVGPGTSIVGAIPHNALSQHFTLAQLYATVT